MRYIIRLLGVFWQNKPKSGSTPGALPPQPKARDFNSNVYFGRTNPTAKGGRVRYFTLAAGPATIEELASQTDVPSRTIAIAAAAMVSLAPRQWNFAGCR
jgi:hypothetical protein